MIGKKIPDKITSVSKKPAEELHNNNDDQDVEITAHKKRYKGSKLKLVWYNNGIPKYSKFVRQWSCSQCIK